jgi:UPF0042 nucleotide-binding protein
MADELNNASDPQGRAILVTGMSGAGRSSALKALEDLGYAAVDNLPLSLFSGLVRSGDLFGQRPIAIGVDIRTRDFGVEPVLEELDRLIDEENLQAHILFLDCEDDALAQRFTENRRRHPLGADWPLPDVIRLERRLLKNLRERADVLIDTTDKNMRELREQLSARFALDNAGGLDLFILSFSYRAGLPRDADLVFDVRFLFNPHYDVTLRPLTGRDSRVAAAIAADSDFEPFFANLTSMLDRLLPRYEREGKSYLTIAIGCPGGRHRSVYVAERLGQWLTQDCHSYHLSHRDVDSGADRDML